MNPGLLAINKLEDAKAVLQSSCSVHWTVPPVCTTLVLTQIPLKLANTMAHWEVNCMLAELFRHCASTFASWFSHHVQKVQ